MEKIAVHPIVDCDDYFACLDEFRMDDGGTMLVAHIDVHRYSPAVLRSLKKQFDKFRSSTSLPVFVFEPSPDDAKWERFVRYFNFQFCGRTIMNDGLSHRFFLSVPNVNIDHSTRPEPDLAAYF